MIYLLDTDTMVFMIRGLKSKGQTKRGQSLRKRARLLVDRCKQAQSDANSVAVSAITIAELEYGARRSKDYESEIAAVRKILLPFDTYCYDGDDCAYHYGCIRYELEASGARIGPLDLLIAAHALSLEATLDASHRGGGEWPGSGNRCGLRRASWT